MGALAYLAALFAPRSRAAGDPARARREPLARRLVGRRARRPRGRACCRSGSPAPRSSPPISWRSGSTRRPSRSRRSGPSQAGRFYGVSNLLETMLLLPALLGAALLGRAGDRRRAHSRSSPSRATDSAPTAAASSSCSPRYATLVASPARRASRRAARRPRAAARVVGSPVSRSSGSTRRSGGRATSPDAVGDGPGCSARRHRRPARALGQADVRAVGPAFAVLASLAVLAGRRHPPSAAARHRRTARRARSSRSLVNDTPGDVLGDRRRAAFAVRRFEDSIPRSGAGRALIDSARCASPDHRPRAARLRRLAPRRAGCSDGRGDGDAGDGRSATIPEETTGGGNEELPALELTGDAAAGEAGLRERRLRRVPHALGGRVERHSRAEPRRREALATSSRSSGSRSARAGCPRSASSSSHSRSPTSRSSSPRRRAAEPPPGRFRARGRGVRLRPRRDARSGATALLATATRAAITRSQGAGVPVLVATGRMFRSVERVPRRGRDLASRSSATRAPPSSTLGRGSSSSTSPSSSRSRARRSPRSPTLGLSPNVYVDDELYVAEETEYSRAYSGFQRLPVTEVGDLLAWLDRPPTKLVAVAEPDVLAEVRAELVRRFSTGRVFLTTSLPYLLELGHPAVTKGSGLAFVAAELGLDLGRRRRVRGRRERRRAARGRRFRHRGRGRASTACSRSPMRRAPGPEREGVAAVIEAVPRLVRVIDLKAARANADATRAALARKGAADAFDRAPRSRRALAGARPAGRRAPRSRTKLKGKPTPEQLSELQGVKAELKAAEEPLAACGGGARRARPARPQSPPRRRPGRLDRGRRRRGAARRGAAEPDGPARPPRGRSLRDGARGEDVRRALRLLGRRHRSPGARALPTARSTGSRRKGSSPCSRPCSCERTRLIGTGAFPSDEANVYELQADEPVPRRHGRDPASRASMRGEILDRRRAAAPLRRVLALLPARGGRGRTRHARDDPRAPVQQGRAVLAHAPRRVVGRARAAAREHRGARRGRSSLPYRVVVLPAGDMSSASAKTYDVEIWFPSQARYRETASISNTTDFQARRLQIRFRGEHGPEPVHLLNGTAVVDRMALAILENFQGEVPGRAAAATGHLTESPAETPRAVGVPRRRGGYVQLDHAACGSGPRPVDAG